MVRVRCDRKDAHARQPGISRIPILACIRGLEDTGLAGRDIDGVRTCRIDCNPPSSISIALVVECGTVYARTHVNPGAGAVRALEDASSKAADIDWTPRSK